MQLLGCVEANKRAGNHIITTAIEHASVQQVFEHLKEEGYRVTYLPVDVSGVISLEALEEALDEETIFVSIMQVNNEIGTVEPIEEAVQLIRKKAPKAVIHVDAIQSYGKIGDHARKS